MKKHIRVLLIAGSAVCLAASFYYCEIPAPRYSEPEDYPSRVADELKKVLQRDPAFKGHPFRILWAWSWRWGRYGAVLQVEGVSNQAQQAAVIAYLREIKHQLNTGRFISVESIEGLRDKGGSPRVTGRALL